ncbi:MAG: hypothetical protein AAFU70_13785, partial [Planctomycetota bacterium]
GLWEVELDDGPETARGHDQPSPKPAAPSSSVQATNGNAAGRDQVTNVTVSNGLGGPSVVALVLGLVGFALLGMGLAGDTTVAQDCSIAVGGNVGGSVSVSGNDC